MEQYRHALYRYSTGNGFNVNVDLPTEAAQVASFKMEPLLTRLANPELGIDIKREADRVSMQYEAAMQQIKVLGYDSGAGKRLKNLKLRVELIQHLMTNYPIRYIKRDQLDRLYKLYAENSPGMDNVIKETVNLNKGATGVDDFVGTAMKVRKGYPLFDKFGKRLDSADKKLFNKSEGLSGFGEEQKHSLLKTIAIVLVLAALYKHFTKPA